MELDKLVGTVMGICYGVLSVGILIDVIDEVRYIDGNISTPATLPTGVDSLLTILPLLFVLIIIGTIIFMYQKVYKGG